MSAPQPPRTADVPTLLVKIFGKDRPGITAGLFDTLAAYSVDVIDIEQVVTRGRIVLCALITAPTATEPSARAGCARPFTAGPSPSASRQRSSPVRATTGHVAAAVRMSPCSATH